MNKGTIYQSKINMGSVLKFTLPTMAMTVIQSLYTMVDGVFISNLIGMDALSALTLISPFFNIFTAIAAMFAAGGSAVIMRKMGEGKEQEAREDFTMLLTVNLAIGFILIGGGLPFADRLAGTFGASAAVTSFSQQYLFAYIFFIPAHLLFSNLQMYVIASGRAGLAMGSAVLGGVFNVVFDFVFIRILGFGMAGAAAASGLGMLLPCIAMAICFTKKDRMLHFIKPKFRLNVLLKTMTNGISEFFGNLVSGVVMLLFNQEMLRHAGEDGVAASTIIFYVFGFMSALYMGYMFGVAPLFSYFYGEGNRGKMKKLCRISLIFITAVGIVTTVTSVLGSQALVGVFTEPDMPAYDLAIHGNKLFSAALLLVGYNTFASALFTSLSNGLVSAVISFGRTFVFLTGAILILPSLSGIDGIWLSVPLAELLTLLLSLFFFQRNQNKYGY